MSNSGPKLVLGVAGEMLSGKSTAAAFFEEKFHAKTFRFSAILSKILDVLDLEHSRINMQTLGLKVKELYGEDVLARAIAAEIPAVQAEIVLVDGFRKKEEIDVLRGLKNFKLLFIKAPLEMRYKRLQSRTEKVGESQLTFEQFVEQQQHDVDKEMASLEQYADCVIENTSSVEDLEAKLTAFLTESLC